MTPITEEGLLGIGFESCRRDGELYNAHVYDFQMVGKDFYVERRKPVVTDSKGIVHTRKDDKFTIVFKNYYQENEYNGFEFIEQIQSLLNALYP